MKFRGEEGGRSDIGILSKHIFWFLTCVSLLALPRDYFPTHCCDWLVTRSLPVLLMMDYSGEPKIHHTHGGWMV